MKGFLLLVTHIILLVFSDDITNATCGYRCCINYHKDKYKRVCVECTETYPPQYYGRLCRSICNCSLQQCDRRDGCMSFETKNCSDKHWKYVAMTLIGFITIVLAVGLMKLLKSWLSKRCKQENIVFNECQTGMDNLTPNENHMQENKYEEHRSSPTHDEIEAEHPYNIFVENNYADLRTSALSPIYDNPGDFETDIISAR